MSNIMAINCVRVCAHCTLLASYEVIIGNKGHYDDYGYTGIKIE